MTAKSGSNCSLLRELLFKLPIGHIDAYMAVILDYHCMADKSRYFENISNFLKNGHYCEVSQIISYKSIKCYNSPF